MPAPILPNFSVIQREYILTFINPFDTYLNEHNPSVIPRHQGTTTFMKRTASAIMKHDEFLVENLNGRSPAAVESVRSCYLLTHSL